MALWTWENGTPKERADMVRSHLNHCHGSAVELRKLFHLTEHGAQRILAGDDWKPEYSETPTAAGRWGAAR